MSSSYYENKKLKRKDVKKVYIRKRKKYVALSFDEFNRRKENTYLYTKKKFIVVQGNLLEVTDKVYVDYYAEKEHALYLKKWAKGSTTFSLESLENTDTISDTSLITNELEDDVEKKLTLDKLREGVDRLSDREKLIIEKIYFEGFSERKLAEILSISQTTINYQKLQILNKLKKIIEK